MCHREVAEIFQLCRIVERLRRGGDSFCVERLVLGFRVQWCRFQDLPEPNPLDPALKS
jgi:hypothetical protein